MLGLLMEKIGENAKLEGLTKGSPEMAEKTKQFMKRWKTETEALLTPEQAKIFAEVVTHFQVEPGKFGFNFNF